LRRAWVWAYAPADHSGLIGKIFGKSGVFRAGAGMAYDRFGSDLITQYDQYGSIGLATQSNFPDSYSFSTSPRFTGRRAGRSGRMHRRLFRSPAAQHCRDQPVHAKGSHQTEGRPILICSTRVSRARSRAR